MQLCRTALLLCVCSWAGFARAEADEAWRERVGALERVVEELEERVLRGTRISAEAGRRGRHTCAARILCGAAQGDLGLHPCGAPPTHRGPAGRRVVCAAGSAAARGPPGSVGVPSMATRAVVTDAGCRWGRNMLRAPLYADAGDSLVFFRGGDQQHDVRLLKDEQAFQRCDFTGSELLAGHAALSATERGGAGSNFSYTLARAGEYFFASGTRSG